MMINDGEWWCFAIFHDFPGWLTVNNNQWRLMIATSFGDTWGVISLSLSFSFQGRRHEQRGLNIFEQLHKQHPRTKIRTPPCSRPDYREETLQWLCDLSDPRPSQSRFSFPLWSSRQRSRSTCCNAPGGWRLNRNPEPRCNKVPSFHKSWIRSQHNTSNITRTYCLKPTSMKSAFVLGDMPVGCFG